MARAVDVMQSRGLKLRSKRGPMRVGTMIRFTPSNDPNDRLLDRVADYARRIEASGFPGIWVGDSLGRGHPTLDPLVELATLAAVTNKVELGIGVLQLPLRHPIELAHRVQSVQVLSNKRLVLGVGSGSTKDDFDLLGYDYDKRFGALRSSLNIMRSTWRGEPTNNGGVLSTWPGCEGGPPILIGAWRSHRWITLAAKEYQGWTPSGRYSSWEDLEAGMRVFREAGGTNAVLANLAVDFGNRPGSAELAKVAEPALIGTPDEIRQKLKRMQDIGFNEILIVSHHAVLEDIERARDML
jgi:alkanesulfonate monooxygenase SsuD/methylene tetrahydromethanopterin reductase-like flavin-dependent oxidoreductase (luciferase family)